MGGKKIAVMVLASALVVGCSTSSKYGKNGVSPSGKDAQVATQGYEQGRAFGSSDMSWKERALLAKRTFYFGFDKYGLSDDDKEVLDVHARYLQKHPGAMLRIEGHTDERGSREYNVGLGERRARTVYTYLISRGVSEEQMSEVSYGKEKPADPRHVDEAHDRNRRAYIVYEAV